MGKIKKKAISSQTQNSLHIILMTIATALSYPVFLVHRKARNGEWYCTEKSTPEGINSFHGREDMELFFWYLTGLDLGAVKGWKRAIEQNSHPSFPLHLSKTVTKSLKKKRTTLTQPDPTKRPAHMGTLNIEDFEKTLTGKLYKALPNSLKRDTENWLKAIKTTPVKTIIQSPHEPAESLSAHDIIKQAQIAHELMPVSKETTKIEIVFYPEFIHFNPSKKEKAA